ncbi:MAG: hypothetical protein CSA62_08120 [Planctomycetota bacterium]|nr:MAG: hypothetical protein CSA62_08120 [Planctomycetota bacterium]
MSLEQEPFAIRARGLGKCYEVYRSPQERLLQLLFRGRKRFYRELWALRGIDLDLRAGETVGIVGRNGAGKTTLLQMLAGTLQPTEGELEVRGRVTSLLELGSGFNGEFTGRENVYLNGAVLGVPRAEMEQRFEQIVEFADIGEFLDQPVKTYSSGMFVRLAFSVLANLDPDIFIVDEALAVGDAFFRHRCMYRFAEMQEKGTAILFVSHDALSVKQLCHRVLWIEGGELRDEGDPDRVVDGYLKSLFGVEEIPASEQGSEQEPSGLVDSEPELRFDKRLGDQTLSVAGASLRDERGELLLQARHGQRCVIWLRVRSSGDLGERRWAPGVLLKDFRGLEIASHFEIEAHEKLGQLDPEVEATVRIGFDLPALAPGSYSITLTLNYEGVDRVPVVADRLENCLHFDIVSARSIYCVLGLDVDYDRVASPARGK